MKVTYMNGAGNDFMVIDARGKNLDFSKLAKEFCAVTGADGFMAVDHSDKADFRLHFYNSDGTRAGMCGNGARCICRFAHDLGIAGDQSRHDFVGTGAVDQCKVNAYVFKIPFFDGNILGSIENRVSYFTEGDRCYGIIGFLLAAAREN